MSPVKAGVGRKREKPSLFFLGELCLEVSRNASLHRASLSSVGNQACRLPESQFSQESLLVALSAFAVSWPRMSARRALRCVHHRPNLCQLQEGSELPLVGSGLEATCSFGFCSPAILVSCQMMQVLTCGPRKLLRFLVRKCVTCDCPTVL